MILLCCTPYVIDEKIGGNRFDIQFGEGRRILMPHSRKMRR